MRRLPDGQDFSAGDFAHEKDFGFTGSAQGYDEHPVDPPFAGSRPTTSAPSTEKYAEGGKVEHKEGHAHPHGHKVIGVHHDPQSGAIMHKHAHGGFSMHHPDGHVTHHGADGEPAMARGGAAMFGGHSQEGTHVGKMRHKMPHRGGMPENTPPRDPMKNPSTRNAMPGGQMGMGVEPSAEPDEPPDNGGMPTTPMARGGHARHR